MARFLFFPLTHQIGSTYPLVEIAKYFKSKGHTVGVAGSGRFMELVERAGLDKYHAPEIPYKRFREQLDEVKLDFQPEEEIREFVKSDVRLIRKFKPDAVFGYGRIPLKIATRLTNTLFVSLEMLVVSNYSCGPFYIPEALPFSFFNRIPGLRELLGLGVVFFFTRRAARRYVKVAKEFIPGWEEKTLYDFFEGDISMFLDYEFMYPCLKKRRVQKKLYFLGHIPNTLVKPLSVRDNRRIDNFISSARKRHAKVVLVSMGTSGTKIGKVVESLNQYLQNHRNVYAIVTRTVHPLDSLAGVNGGRMLLVPYVDNREVMPKVDLVISHGGKGTIFQSLLAGKYVFIFPHQVEQEWNAIVFEKLNIGRYFSIHRFNKRAFHRALDLFFSKQESFEKGVLEIREKAQRVDWRRVVDRVESRIMESKV